MNKNLSARLITDLFVKDNYKLTIITGLIILLFYIGLAASFILVFFYDWWWKLTLISGGGYFILKKFMEIKIDNWASNKNLK